MSVSLQELVAPPFEIIGPPHAPVVVALGGISASRHVCATPANSAAGWWDAIVGAGKAVDTRRYRVASFDYLDGGRAHDGRPERIVTTRDQADALAAVLDAAGIDRAHAVVGASYGGMVALSFAEYHADRLGEAVVIGAAHQSHPMTTARRSVQRQIVELGIDTGRETDALTIARALAMTTYRSDAEFSTRFASQPDAQSHNSATFPVEHYLAHHGRRFAERWSTERFLALSLSSDLHSVVPSRIRAPVTLVAIEDDAIAPRTQVEELAALLGGDARVHVLPAGHGHDAFLTNPAALGPILTATLASRRHHD